MYQKLADRIGLPVEEVRAGIWELERKANGLLRPLGLYRHRMEKRLENAAYSLLQKQKKYIMTHTAQLSVFKEKGMRYVSKKALNGELNDMMSNLPHQKEIVEQLYSYGALVTLKAGDRSVKTYGLSKLGISWDLKNKAAIDWLSALKDLHLSNRQGSINNTTKLGIIDIITSAAEQGQSYGDIAKQINALDATLFSRNRAQLIATNTLGKAYEFGNRAPLQEAQNRGNVVEKFWQTVEDDKVTEECSANEDQGWIPMEQPHASGDQQPLRSGNPRCRCTELYRIIPKEGQEVNVEEAPDTPIQEEAKPVPEDTPKQQVTPEVLPRQITLADGSTTMKSKSGHAFHAFDGKYLDDVLANGLTPHITFADQRFQGHPGDEVPRVYFAVDPQLTGVGATMDQGRLTRVPLTEFSPDTTFKDPHIPQPDKVAWSFYTEHGFPPGIIEIQDEFGKFVSVEEYKKAHP